MNSLLVVGGGWGEGKSAFLVDGKKGKNEGGDEK